MIFRASAFIGGNSVNTEEVIEIYDLQNKKLGSIPVLTEEHIQLAFKEASRSFKNWGQLHYKDRAAIVLSWSEKLAQHKLTLSELLQREVGKTEQEASEEVERTIQNIVDFVDAYLEMMENSQEFSDSTHLNFPENITATFLRVPAGVALTISPFNYPLNLAVNKVVPALLTGNCVVHKSATQGSITGWFIVKLFHEMTIEGKLIKGGIFNYVTGKGSVIGSYLLNHRWDAVSFTGSTEVGMQLSKSLQLCPQQMELGGLNSAIILEDANLKKSVELISKSAFTFAGQRCTSLKVAYVHESIYENFEKSMIKIAQNFKARKIVDKNSISALESVLDNDQNIGLRVLTPEWNQGGGCLIPLITTAPEKGMMLFDQEFFVPILSLIKFSDINTVINDLDSSKYGLQTSIFGSDLEAMSDISLYLNVGRVNLNLAPSRSPDCLPFLGVKQSGVGVQGIKESLLFFTRHKGVVSAKELLEKK